MSTFYSCLKASIGCISAAFFAGKYPNTIPIKDEIPTAIATDSNVTAPSIPSMVEATPVKKIPKIIPIVPPITLVVIASITN